MKITSSDAIIQNGKACSKHTLKLLESCVQTYIKHSIAIYKQKPFKLNFGSCKWESPFNFFVAIDATPRHQVKSGDNCAVIVTLV